MSHVEGERADAGVHPGPQQERLIVIKSGDAGIAGKQVI
jgi:hypothetical protein